MIYPKAIFYLLKGQYYYIEVLFGSYPSYIQPPTDFFKILLCNFRLCKEPFLVNAELRRSRNGEPIDQSLNK